MPDPLVVPGAPGVPPSRSARELWLADQFRKHREFTVLLRVEDHWEPVGTKGDLEHVKNEMADWRRDAPGAVLVYGQRDVGPWTLGDEQ